ncbi:MAG: DUF4249 domain-containing protein [Ferruginibacter sp.]
MKFVIAGLLTLFILTGCEKNIDFDLDDAEPVLAVDGQIENDQAPLIVLTKSFSYFEQLSPQLLSNAFVHDAEVYISNGSLTHRLKEYAYELVPGINAYYYSIDSSSLATAFTGSLGGNYSLRIVSEGKEYTAVTNIPAASNFPDSVWFKPAPQNPDTNKRVMYVKVTDPPGRGNYYRYFTKINSGAFLACESVLDDQIIDGTTFTVQFPPGIDRNDPIERDKNFYTKGDTAVLKFCSINKASYTFWNTWEFARQSIGNPFAQPNKVIGNISNGALGAFCGYAAGYKTYIVD